MRFAKRELIFGNMKNYVQSEKQTVRSGFNDLFLFLKKPTDPIRMTFQWLLPILNSREAKNRIHKIYAAFSLFFVTGFNRFILIKRSK